MTRSTCIVSRVSVLGICGSLQPASFNSWLLDRFAEGSKEGEFVRSDLLGAIPHYNTVLDADPAPPPVSEFRRQLEACDAVLIASPEYGHGMPGSLKNALDWTVSSGELVAKRVAITCAAQGPGRGLLGLAMLRQTLEGLDAQIVWDEPLIVPRRDDSADAAVPVEERLAPLRRALGLPPSRSR